MIHHNRLLGFDTESSGLDLDESRIVQAGLVDVPHPATPEVRTILINPGVHIPREASDIHGITDEIAVRDGAEPGGVIELVIDTIYAAWAQGVPLVIYNAPYDTTLLDRESRRHLGRPFEVTGPIIDPLVIARAHLKVKGGFKLENLCKTYQIPLSGAHDAGVDALATTRLLWRFCDNAIKVNIVPWDRGEGPDKPITRDDRYHTGPADQVPRHELVPLAEVPLDHLMRAQSRWHRYWADGLGSWLKDQGKTDDVNRQWPIITKLEAV